MNILAQYLKKTNIIKVRWEQGLISGMELLGSAF